MMLYRFNMNRSFKPYPKYIIVIFYEDYTTSLNVFVNEYDVHSWSIYKVDDVLFDRL